MTGGKSSGDGFHIGSIKREMCSSSEIDSCLTLTVPGVETSKVKCLYALASSSVLQRILSSYTLAQELHLTGWLLTETLASADWLTSPLKSATFVRRKRFRSKLVVATNKKRQIYFLVETNHYSTDEVMQRIIFILCNAVVGMYVHVSLPNHAPERSGAACLQLHLTPFLCHLLHSLNSIFV